MRERTLVKDLAAREDGPVLLGGWVEKLRDQKRIQFIILRDESGDVQVTYPRPVVITTSRASPTTTPALRASRRR